MAPVTTTIRGIPVEVPLDVEDGLPKPCTVNCDSIVTIPKAYLESKIGRLSNQKIGDIHRAVRFALNMP